MNKLGVQGPVGFWDPLGFGSDGNAERFRRRQTELKHVGISMLATMGCIALEFTGKLLGYFSTPMGIKFTKVLTPSRFPERYRLQVGFDLRVLRMLRVVDGSVGRLTGWSLRLWFRGAHISVSEQSKAKLSAELTNGHLSVMVIVGLFFQDGHAGLAWIAWAPFTAFPRRALETYWASRLRSLSLHPDLRHGRPRPLNHLKAKLWVGSPLCCTHSVASCRQLPVARGEGCALGVLEVYTKVLGILLRLGVAVIAEGGGQTLGAQK